MKNSNPFQTSLPIAFQILAASKAFGVGNGWICRRVALPILALRFAVGPCPDGLTLERRDRKGNYEPQNCKWADEFEQANNRSNNRALVFSGKTMNLFQWAREVGLPPKRLSARLASGWSIERALTTPNNARAIT